MEKINVCVWSFIGALPSTLLWAMMQLASTPIAPVWAYGSKADMGNLENAAWPNWTSTAPEPRSQQGHRSHAGNDLDPTAVRTVGPPDASAFSTMAWWRALGLSALSTASTAWRRSRLVAVRVGPRFLQWAFRRCRTFSPGRPGSKPASCSATWQTRSCPRISGEGHQSNL